MSYPFFCFHSIKLAHDRSMTGARTGFCPFTPSPAWRTMTTTTKCMYIHCKYRCNQHTVHAQHSIAGVARKDPLSHSFTLAVGRLLLFSRIYDNDHACYKSQLMSIKAHFYIRFRLSAMIARASSCSLPFVVHHHHHHRSGSEHKMLFRAALCLSWASMKPKDTRVSSVKSRLIPFFRLMFCTLTCRTKRTLR